MLPFALSIFTGAFLLFQVQPLIGKYILPWFGGGPGVWTTCLLFFQTLLLGGYAYAHFTSTRLTPKRQAMVHLALLALALLLLPITPADTWKPDGLGDPTWHILMLLLATIGLPYFVLSSTGPLMQQWFSVTNPGVSPYRLYALSNVGSLLALLSYPVFFEVKFSRYTQSMFWSAGLVFFALACGYCAWRVWRYSAPVSPAVPAAPLPLPVGVEVSGPASPAISLDRVDSRDIPIAGTGAGEDLPVTPSAEATTPTSAVDKMLWFALPAIASILLLATTNKLSQEVAVIPFLWVLPLSLYLLTFIISFDHARWYHRGVFSALLVLAIAVVFQVLPAGTDVPMKLQIVVYSAAMFVACMVCHGELYRLKPPPRRLTSYFLSIAAGGALGGFLVAIVAPAIFNDYRELEIGYWLLTYGLGVLCFRHRSREMAMAVAVGALMIVFVLPWMGSYFDGSPGLAAELMDFLRSNALIILAGIGVVIASFFHLRTLSVMPGFHARMAGFVMILCVLVGAVVVVQWPGGGSVPVLSATRNFYGTLKVYDYNADDEEDRYHLLLHGATTHGLQFVQPERSVMPTTYYGENSGVGLALDNMPDGPRRIGIVGLGTGSLLVYGRADDYMRIYEINPAVHDLARRQFTYLENTPAKVDIVMGDARLMMEREIAQQNLQQFDLLALDAFSSDAIPVHLLTKEAFELYLRHLKPDGIIAVHVSNRYLRLRPVVERVAEHLQLSVAVIYDDYEPEWWLYATTWILVTRNQAFLEQPAIADIAEEPDESARPGPFWTDDYASLYSIMK
jgi:SAM-dependent methyltransferase